MLMPRYLPMLVPPEPWRRYNRGAYLTFQSPVMRVRGEEQQMRLLREADQQMESGSGRGMQTVYDALNALGR